jgi:hypothetical protein
MAEKDWKKRITHGLENHIAQPPDISSGKEDEKQRTLHYNHRNTREDRCRNRTHTPKGCQSDRRAEAQGFSTEETGFTP